MEKNLKSDKEYFLLLKELKEKVKNSQIKASVRVNSELILMYWELGETIVSKQSNSNWGDGLIDQLSKDLTKEFPEMKGFSKSNLKYIRKWFLFYFNNDKKSQQVVDQLIIASNIFKVNQKLLELQSNKKSQQVVDQLKLKAIMSLIPWGHHIEIITKCKTIESAFFYILNTIENDWSRSVLVHQIELHLFEKQGKSINNFELTLPQSESDLAREILKSQYSLEFLSIGKKVKEKNLQNALLDNISKFLMELGYGFAFLGKQKLLTVGGDDFYVDLVFYHTKLHCYFIVELKVDGFKPEYSGKLNFYINAFNAQIKNENDKPTIGLLLCKKANKLVAEYSLKGITNPLGVSEYILCHDLPQNLMNELPSIEEIEKELSSTINQ